MYQGARRLGQVLSVNDKRGLFKMRFDEFPSAEFDCSFSYKSSAWSYITTPIPPSTLAETSDASSEPLCSIARKFKTLIKVKANNPGRRTKKCTNSLYALVHAPARLGIDTRTDLIDDRRRARPVRCRSFYAILPRENDQGNSNRHTLFAHVNDNERLCRLSNNEKQTRLVGVPPLNVFKPRSPICSTSAAWFVPLSCHRISIVPRSLFFFSPFPWIARWTISNVT